MYNKYHINNYKLYWKTSTKQRTESPKNLFTFKEKPPKTEKFCQNTIKLFKNC